MKKLTALVLASGIALSTGTIANAMSDGEMVSMGQSMLTGALFNNLRAGGHSTNGIEKLTLSEVALLNSLLNDDDMQNGATGQIKLIFDRASKR
jgi:hypothetical protein